MVNRVLYKNVLVKIRKSFGRFLSLFMIVFVGAGFFAGIQASAPDIIASVSQYNDRSSLMDDKIVSTMGLTDGDVTALKSLKNVSGVFPSYSLDVLDRGKAVRLQAIEKSVNTFDLLKGRMPKTDTECVADSETYRVGDKIVVSGDVKGKLKNTEFTVVGTARSPLYLWHDYGNTTVGDGKLTSFLFVNRSNFTLNAFTEIFVRSAGTAPAYSQEYDSLVSQLNQQLMKLKPAREEARDQEIRQKASDEINKNKTTLDNEKAKGEKELADAKAQLDAGQSKLKKAQTELAQNESNLQNQIKTQNASFQSAKEQIAEGRTRIGTALQQIGITQEELGGRIDALNSAIRALKEQRAGIPSGSPEDVQLGQQIDQATAACRQLSQLQGSIEQLNSQEQQLNVGISTFNTQIAGAKQKLAEGKTQLADNAKKLDDGYSEYNTNLDSFHAKIADAQTKIQDAENKLTVIAKPQWTVLGRDSVVAGSGTLKSGSEVVSSVAKLFPIFFILIALLMTSNTMARMIAEERGEIGTLSSLGFQDGSILSTYLLYVLSATVSGAVIGYFAGCTIIPKIIYACFPFMLPPVIIQYNIGTLLMIVGVASAIMIAVTTVFCHHELKGMPAALMRPVPPENGQTIFLEKVKPVWKRLSFTWKVTLRNLFRYKQRVAMTIIGIAGCTALLLTGFGVKDSIGGVAQKQYGGIFRYDALFVLKNDTRSISGNLEKLLKKEPVQNPVLIRQSAFTCESAGKSLDAYLIVPENEGGFSEYFSLKSTLTGNRPILNDSGVIVSQKLASTFRIGRGDKFVVKDADGNRYELPVSDVAENHIQDYIYMSKGLYGKIFGKPASYNIIVSGCSGDRKTLAQQMIGSNLVVNANFRDDMLSQTEGMNKSLDSVVVLIVCVASLLMVIVLYNLTSINISERKREIATLKVLGFSDGETNEYVYREAMILSLISIGIGLAMGVGMHRFIMDTINANAPILFFKQINGLSYLWTLLITAAVSIVMQIITYFKLRTVDMIESLKSVE